MTAVELTSTVPPTHPAGPRHEDLARHPISARCCLNTELTVTLRLAGVCHLDNGLLRLSVVLDHPAAARRLAASIRAFSGYQPIVERSPAPARPNRQVVRLDTGAAALASKLGLCASTGCWVPGLPAHLGSAAACCRGAAWRAAYLATGTLTGSATPVLSVGCPDRTTARALAALANRSAPRARVNNVGPARVLVEVPGEVAKLLVEMGAQRAIPRPANAVSRSMVDEAAG